MKLDKGELSFCIDFGTDSVRAVVAYAADGAFAGSGVSNYRRWAEGNTAGRVKTVSVNTPSTTWKA